jgi:hypothetical protein
MTNHPKVLNLPTNPLQKNIPLELNMVREIARENVTAELLKARFEEAGYEALVEEDGAIYLPGSLINLRVLLFTDHHSLALRGWLSLNPDLTEEALQKICHYANQNSYMIRYSSYKQDGDNVALFGNYIIYYTFGLNMPNLIFCIRKFVEMIRAFYEEHKKDERIFPKTN